MPTFRADPPLAYLITFRCFGTWLHGDERGSVYRTANAVGEPMIPPNSRWLAYERYRASGSPTRLTATERPIVAEAIGSASLHRGWRVLALNVRTEHVHCVVVAAGPPEPVMTAMKAWATRRLHEHGLAQPDRPVWSRHGSTHYLWSEDDVEQAVRYVVNAQGADLD